MTDYSNSTSNALSVQQLDSVSAQTDKIKILFYHAGFENDVWIYTAALQLKTHIDLNYPELADRLQWLIPLQIRVTDEELIEHINQSQADVFCTGHYVWNHEFLINQMSVIRDKISPHVKIISGGPSINVNIEPDFFDRHPYIDYAVYGAGEQAFSDILHHIVLNRPLIAMATSNCGWQQRDTGKQVVAAHKYVKMIETSPFLHNRKLFTSMIKNLVRQGKTQLWLAYTVTRGCPYKCTFCDWNSGFDTKVTRRKNSYRDEIDLFQKLQIKKIMWSDANFGQYAEDIEIAEYMAEKNINEGADFTIISGNFSKLKKDANLKIFHTMIKSKLVKSTLALSIQDTNAQVLENINRPDVGWDVHAAMADELYQAWPHMTIEAQLIYGLPGQTVATWHETLRQLTSRHVLPIIYVNQPLPASPAMYDSEYQKKFQFEYVPGYRIGTFDHTYYTSLMPKQCVSFNQFNMVEMHTLGCVYLGFCIVKIFCWKELDVQLDIDVMVDQVLTQSWYQDLQQQLYQNWTQDQNYFYVIEDTKITDTKRFGYFMVVNEGLFARVLALLPADLQQKFSQPDVKSALCQYATEVMYN